MKGRFYSLLLAVFLFQSTAWGQVSSPDNPSAQRTDSTRIVLHRKGKAELKKASSTMGLPMRPDEETGQLNASPLDDDATDVQFTVSYSTTGQGASIGRQALSNADATEVEADYPSNPKVGDSVSNTWTRGEWQYSATWKDVRYTNGSTGWAVTATSQRHICPSTHCSFRSQ